jgi:hypothetical protein
MDEMLEALEQALNEYRINRRTTSFIHKIGHKHLRILKRLSFILLLLAAIILYWWFNSNATSKPVSIAILPLENISNNSGQQCRLITDPVDFYFVLRVFHFQFFRAREGVQLPFLLRLKYPSAMPDS